MWTVQTLEIILKTEGFDQVVDVTPRIRSWAAEQGVRDGLVTVFIPGATASVTTLEFEPGLVKDLREVLEQNLPYRRAWVHHQTWGDDNGGAHLRAALLGPSLTVPLKDGRLQLGRWQQIVVIEHDTGPRERRVIFQLMGIKKAS